MGDICMSGRQWRRTDVTDAYLTGDAFDAVVRSEDERVAAVLQRLGL